MATPYSKRAFIQRIKRHVTNNRLISSQFPITDNEMVLYIDQAAAARIVGQTYAGAKLEGFLVMPEAYLRTYALPTLVQDPATWYWSTALPQPPLALPLGYSVNRVYPKSLTYGVMKDAYPIKAKRVGRRMNMQMQPGVRYWIENNILILAAHDNAPLDNLDWFIQMPSARTTDLDAVMNMPEDDLQFVFDTVVKEILQRYGVPQDIILDDLPAGNKTS